MMNIGVYAGSIRPGGGLTVLIQILKTLSKDVNNRLLVYTGSNDTSDALQPVFSNCKNAFEKRFLPQHSAPVRHFYSKLFFLKEAVSQKFDCLFSFNYYLPAKCPVVVYHINLLSFQHGPDNNIAMLLKRIDARLACRCADLNIFESSYLMKVARNKVQIKNPALLYIGVDPVFFRTGKKNPGQDREVQRNSILLVSSIQRHKDNEICLYVLKILNDKYPQTQWKLKIAGGQSITQWNGFERRAKDLGVVDHIEIVGPVERQKLAEYMSQSLCLINPSRIESFCMVAIESMAASCPVIVTNATSMPESVGNAALIVEPGDAKQFVQKFLMFYNDEDLRQEYIRRGKYRASEFTERVFSKNLIDLLSCQSK